jgi:hypothetical protein
MRPGEAQEHTRLLAKMSGLLTEFDRASPRVVVYNVDPVLRREPAREIFGLAGLEPDELPEKDSVVLVYGGERLDVELDAPKFLEAGATRELFRGEQILTSKILELTSERKRVYFLRGHGEKLPTELQARRSYVEVGRALRRHNFDVEEVSLAERGQVPEDASVLVIAGPMGPLTETEARAVARFLEAGGGLFLLLDPEPNLADFGLNDLLEGFGIRPRSDYLCLRGFGRARLTGQMDWAWLPDILVPNSQYTLHPIVEPLRNRFRTWFPGACPVEAQVVEGEDAVDPQEILYMPRISQSGQPQDNVAVRQVPGFQEAMKNRRLSEEAGDIIGRTPLGVASERPVDGEEGRTARVVVIGDSDFALSVHVGRTQNAVPANLTLFVNAVQWLGRRESYIAIAPKTLEYSRERVDFSDADVDQREVYRRAAFWIPVLFLPLLMTFLGLAVWWRRRQ